MVPAGGLATLSAAGHRRGGVCPAVGGAATMVGMERITGAMPPGQLMPLNWRFILLARLIVS